MASLLYPSDVRITDVHVNGVSIYAPTLAPVSGMSVTFTLIASWDGNGNGISPEDRKVIDEGTEACIDAAMLNYEWPRVNVFGDAGDGRRSGMAGGLSTSTKLTSAFAMESSHK